jgi:hypothetical protein
MFDSARRLHNVVNEGLNWLQGTRSVRDSSFVASDSVRASLLGYADAVIEANGRTIHSEAENVDLKQCTNCIALNGRQVHGLQFTATALKAQLKRGVLQGHRL